MRLAKALLPALVCVAALGPVARAAPHLLKPPAKQLRSKPRVALFLGTFDPFHEDHFAIAALGRSEGADEVLLVPSWKPSHKPNATPIDRRLGMIAARIRNEPHINLYRGDASLHLRLGQSAFVEHVKSLYDTDDVTIYVGQDAYEEGMKKWGIPSDIAYKYRIVPRGNGAAPSIPDNVKSKVSVVPRSPVHGTSSTEVRQRLHEGRLVSSEALHPTVQAYIRAHRLYE